MLVILLGAVLAIIGFCPETEIAKVLRRALVEAPARMLAQMTRRRTVVLLATLALLLVAIVLARLLEDGVVSFWFLPEGVAWMAAFDVASYLEIMAAVWLVAGALSLRAVDRAIRSAAARARQWALNRLRVMMIAAQSLGRRALRIRTRVAPPKKGDDSDRPAPGFAFA